MKKTLLFMGQIIFCVVATSAQEVMSTQGTSFSNSSGGVEFTVGEVMTSTYYNGTNYLTNGFHQTQLVISSIEDNASHFEVSIFPNPVMNELTIKFSEIQFGYQLELMDINGKLVKTHPLSDTETKLNVQDIAAGVYMLLLKDEEGEYLKTYQLHKLN